ncbi:MAG: TonB-dependent receptor [Gammaproteobacteria bacterium]|nr:TonB-dependent receptor [Gammaproteobacteria bacterium]
MFGIPVWALPTCEQAVGQFVSIQGAVEVQGSQAAAWTTPATEAVLCEGDTVRVGERSRAEVALINDAVLRIDQNTTIRLLDIAEKTTETSLLSLVQGAFASLSRKPRRMTVSTPYVNGTIEGTEFLMSIAGAEAEIRVLEGRVVAANDQGSMALGPGEAAVAAAGSPPVRQLVVRPRDAVHWALYYQPVVDLSADAWPAGPGWEGAVRASVDAYLKGDLQNAFAQLGKVPDSVGDPRLLAYRASLLLAVGRVDQANVDIERILGTHPDDGNARALKTIVAVAQGDKAGAMDIGTKAVNGAPDSPAAWLALSYAQQAQFDLQGARASVERAVLLDQNNALAWARLAEIQLSFADVDAALRAAEKAASLQPDLSRTQTVLGFAHLTRIETQPARAAFARAIALDQGDPMPRLGMGLASIRDGELAQGRHQLEIAASLDPNNSIIRSYLGKAYFEEKRDALVDREYITAREVDPNDPTPWFYSAIQKQTTNRPVAALEDMQKAVELNDNRAVYRSRLLLDSDLAARSASQARVYSDLGFEQLALVEGWKSVNVDPTNFSAHRLLADSYAGVPRHEIARVSELLQSQLLQPLSVTPVQPQLSESNLFLIGAGGPGSLGFNEFNQLFNSDGLRLQTNGLLGEDGTHGEDAVVSGIYQHISFSVGGFHYHTDGFRDNSDQSDDMANAFVQAELSPETSVQAEYRYRDTEQGDVQQRFFKEDILNNLRNMENKEVFRVGGRHNLADNSVLLVSLTYQDAKTDQTIKDFPFPSAFFAAQVPETAFGAEAQHLYRTDHLNLQSGVGLMDVNGKLDLAFSFPEDPTIASSTGTDLRHTNAYSYADIEVLKNLKAILGLSYDAIIGDEADKDQLNPKLGLIWTPVPDTTLRAAAFRALKRTLITNQTLEPTQVAGFNQFYDDANLTEAWTYGVALDQRFAPKLFGGMELSTRDLQVPFTDVSELGVPVNRAIDWTEYLGRAYLFWTPATSVALRAEYILERYERDKVIGPKELNTQRIPLGVRFFDPSGWGGFVTATYWKQDGTFAGFLAPGLRSGNDQFWLLDAGVSYRLPARRGLLSLSAVNLTNEDFRFFEVDVNNTTIQPERALVARFTLSFQ